ncbi:MPS1 [Candida oxycetoniae]|uniref:MPS1 n=1 Tax=Candida oxycetoniae TaxID=497107 RepID=A0AAI9T119_9ASCO|nr:MPS1 [Candida oxycetoniae]KAI3406913.2 MPS1 [Candida oxycetoniae]
MSYESIFNVSTHVPNSLKQISPVSSNSTKRHRFEEEEDPTCLPPSLSSYSIATLNAKSKTYLTANTNATTVTGIYEQDFPGRTNPIRSKLAAHFANGGGSGSGSGSNDIHSSTTNNQDPTPTPPSFTRSSCDAMEGKSSSVSKSLSSSSKNDDIARYKRKRRFGKMLGSPKRASQTAEPRNIEEMEIENKSGMKADHVTSVIDEELISKRVEERRALEQLEQQREREREQKRIEEQAFERERLQQRQLKEQELMEKKQSANNRFILSNFEIPKLDIEQENLDAKVNISPLRSPFKEKRVPLRDVSPNVFRKPRLPRSTIQKPSPPPQQYHVAPKPEPVRSPKPLLPTASHQHRPRSANMHFADDDLIETKKRTVNINGKAYEKLELIGRGGSSKVYRIKSCADGRQYALKKVSLNQFENISGFKGEIDLLIKLKHSKRVVKLIDHAVFSSSIYLIMERGDIDLAMLFQNRINAKLPLDIHFVKYHTFEMFKCVEDVHNAGIVHSDLKPANFLMVKGVLKIIDFGIANAVPDHTVNIYRESQIGTPNYMAPEALVEANLAGAKNTTWKVGRPSDVWSCGCILYQFIYGKPPYAAYSGTQRIMALMNPQIKIQYPATGLGDVKVPLSAIELMKNCLVRDPADRWTIEQCLASDFFQPKVVDETFISKIVHQSMNLGFNKRILNEGMSADDYDSMVDDIVKQIEAYNC